MPCSDEELTIETLINFQLMKSLVLHLLDNVAQQFLQKLIPLFSFYLPTLQRQLLYKFLLNSTLKLIKKIIKSTLFTNLTPYQNRDLQINQYGTAFSRAGE